MDEEAHQSKVSDIRNDGKVSGPPKNSSEPESRCQLGTANLSTVTHAEHHH